MSNILKNYIYIFLILIICLLTFHIPFKDYIRIKYFFPNKTIFIAIHILIHYFYLNIIFEYIKQYLEVDIFIFIRMKKAEFRNILIKKVIKYIIFFSIFSIITDVILYKNICIVGLIFIIFIELISCIFIILLYKTLHAYVLFVTFIISFLLRVFLFTLYNIYI